jgi:hypothetical protein
MLVFRIKIEIGSKNFWGRKNWTIPKETQN